MLIIVPRQRGTGINSTEAIRTIQTTRLPRWRVLRSASARDEAHQRANTVGTTTLASNTRSRRGRRTLALVPAVFLGPGMTADILTTCRARWNHLFRLVLTNGYGIHRRDVRRLEPPDGVPQTSEGSPIWGSDIQGLHEAILRGGWKREAGQASCGGDGISVGPSLCWWSSRALVSHGAPSR